MADIIVDVSLPNPIDTNVTSPTQDLNANIYVPGPQGPAGPIGPSGVSGATGPSGAIGPSGARGTPTTINSLSGENITITGADGNIVYTTGLNTIFISGNSGYFQSAINTLRTNLQNTGSNLYTLLTNFSGNLDATYATDLQLYTTGSTLDNKINSLSGYSASDINLATTGSNLNSKINSLSGWGASSVNLASTGSTLDSKINSLSGNLTSTYSTILNLASTGSNLNNTINSLSGTVTGNYVTKSNGQFINRPTVNGTGVLLSGEAAALPNTILYTTGNQIKSGRLAIGDTIVDENYPYTLSIQSNNNNTWLEILNHSGSNKGVFFGIEGNDFEQYNWQAGDIKFFTSENFSNGTERLRIKNDGKVGIGTSSPSELLEVIGNVKASGASFIYRPTVNGTGVLLSGDIPYVQTNSYFYVDATRTDSYVENGNILYPYKTLSGAYNAAKNIASFHNPTYITLLSPIAENLTIDKGYINLIGNNTNKNDPIRITGSLVFAATGIGTTATDNNFSIAGLGVTATSNNKCILFSGNNPQRLFIQDCWLIAKDNGTCLYSNNTNTTSRLQGDILKLSPEGVNTTAIDIVSGTSSISFAETSSSASVLAYVRNNSTLNISNSQIETNGVKAFQVENTARLTLLNSVLTNTANPSTGIFLKDAFSTAVVVGSAISVPANANSYAINGVANSYLFYKNLYFSIDAIGGSTESKIGNNVNKNLINSYDPVVYSIGDQTISGVKTFNVFPIVSGNQLITGDLSLYATKINLATTGATLITNLFNTGSDLNTKIDNLSGYVNSQDTNISSNLTTTGSTLDNKINSLSGVTVLTYGDQTINGLKDFTTRPTVNTTPVLLSGENANGLTVLVKNDEPATLLKGQPVYIYGANGNNILVRKASNTGEAYSSKTLGLLAQDLTSNAQGLVITEGSLEGINTNAGNAGDPIWLGPTGDLIFGLAQKPYAPNHLVYLGVIERKQSNNGKIYVKVQNGFELEELHNVNINHKNALNGNDILRYNSASGLWFNETLNTGIFQTQINSLSGSSVLLYGDQSIGGVKTFRDNVYINNLFVTGTQTVVSTNNFSVQSPYLLLNLTGGAVDGGIFFVTGSGLTGINDYGPIIGFDHSNKFKIGVARRSDDLSFLPDIASVQQIEAYSGVANNTFSTIINLASTGSNLNNKINSLSGWSASALNLASTGSTLDSKINSLSGWSASAINLFNTGSTLDSKINSLSGNLTSNYATISNLALTGSTLDSKINSLSGWSASSVNLATTGSTLNSKINSLSGWSASAINLSSTGSTLDSKINSLSGWSASAANLASTGSTLNTRINNLSGYINSTSSNIVFTTGNQTISGTKTFIQDTTFGDSSQGDFLVISGNQFTVYGSGNFTSGLFVNGNAVLTGNLYATSVNLASTGSTLDNKINSLSGYVTGITGIFGTSVNLLNTYAVFTTGNQIINGLKTFTSGIDIYSGASPQSLRIFNRTGTNSGEFSLIGWTNNQFVIGSQQSQSGILRDVVITGNNININGSGALNIFDNTNIVGNLNITGNSNIRGTLDVTGLTISGLGSSFILKSPNNQTSVSFDGTINGNAGALFSNWVYSSNVSSRGDDNFDHYYGGGGTRSVRFIGGGAANVNRAILDSNGNFGIASGISSVPSRFYVSGNSILQGNLTVSGNVNISGNYDVYSQIENSKKLALAYAIAL